jgi:hypothetical protein
MTNDAPPPLDPAVQRFIDSLDQVPWFRNVGEPVANPAVRQVSSWDAAWEALQDESWTHASVHYQVDQGHPAWAAAYDRALELVEASSRNHELQDGVHVALQAAYDAGAAAHEIATGQENGFFTGLMGWYRKGHWPCGWSGTYPAGTLIIF